MSKRNVKYFFSVIALSPTLFDMWAIVSYPRNRRRKDSLVGIEVIWRDKK